LNPDSPVHKNSNWMRFVPQKVLKAQNYNQSISQKSNLKASQKFNLYNAGRASSVVSDISQASGDFFICSRSK